MKQIHIAMGQITVEGGKPDANLARAVKAIETAASQGNNVIVLPECLDLGWTDPSARQLAQTIPGPHSDMLAVVARKNDIFVAAGLVERSGDTLYNSAVLISDDGEILLHHRKINELDIAQDLYAVGDRLGVAKTPLGTFGLDICADNFASSLAIGHVLARMGAQVLLSPSAWAVDAAYENSANTFGQEWVDAYSQLARLYDITVVGVSNVGWITAGPWKGKKCVGGSVAVGHGGTIIVRAPYGEKADAVVGAVVDVNPPVAMGTGFEAFLNARGYRGI